MYNQQKHHQQTIVTGCNHYTIVKIYGWIPWIFLRLVPSMTVCKRYLWKLLFWVHSGNLTSMEHGSFEDVFPIENGDFPASYVSLPEGLSKNSGRFAKRTHDMVVPNIIGLADRFRNLRMFPREIPGTPKHVGPPVTHTTPIRLP